MTREELLSHLQCDELGFCMCGCPEDNLKFIYDLLTIRKNYLDKIKEFDFLFNPPKKELSKELYRNYENELELYIKENWEKALDFFWYTMDKIKIMDHGTVMPGWLSNHDFYKRLKKYMEMEETIIENNDE